ncbi:MAG TPA: tRNA (guanosine(46)-N7)-methyltransferase TrmB [Spirochaetales bacterium]|nr:tRNA (guanosine(46)-N7)-methyltransferase TrmB [Spirochaetia bacterium]HPE36590.1 tRNA (guanosine(46)-N7)-methyltransferase TrmB [Spirochaetales bacterium]
MENTPARLTGGPLSAREVGIRSYVVRSGRMTDGQKDALNRLYPAYGVPWEPGRMLDSTALFGADAPFVVEIGFGMGLATAAIAEALPGTSFLGLEVHAPGVGKLLSEIEARGLANLRVCRHDAVEVVGSMLAPGSVDGFHVFFPDPWPKKRHHKRRIMNPDFIRLLAERLKPGGYIYYVTDWEEYAEWTLDALGAEPLLRNQYGRWAERESWRPVTKFEERAVNGGRAVRELKFVRV